MIISILVIRQAGDEHMGIVRKEFDENVGLHRKDLFKLYQRARADLTSKEKHDKNGGKDGKQED